MIVGGLAVIPWLNNRYTFFLATRYIMPIVLCSILLVAHALVHILRVIRLRVKKPRPYTLSLSAILVILLIAQLVPFYRYCAQVNNSNLSNQVALSALTLVNHKLNDRDAVVLLEKDLRMENQPLPYLLTLSRLNYVIVPSPSESSAQVEPWATFVKRYPDKTLLAVMNQSTYNRIKDTIPTKRTYPLYARVAFPRPTFHPRAIYVVELEKGTYVGKK